MKLVPLYISLLSILYEQKQNLGTKLFFFKIDNGLWYILFITEYSQSRNLIQSFPNLKEHSFEKFKFIIVIKSLFVWLKFSDF